MTIGVPGNVPYIITVGAMTDDYTPEVMNDDKLASFSSAGPTYEGFVKPEIVAPGGHLPGLMSFDTQIAYDHPEYHDGGRYFQMSGTSQAAAVVSGVVALMLTEQPWLTPDEVKCRLMDGARLATTNNSELAYSVFQQGAGVVNAADSLASVAANCANTNLDINKDLAGIQHYAGTANVNENGNFYVEGFGDEYVWQVTEEFNSNVGHIWGADMEVDIFIWNSNLDVDIFIWNSSFWTDIFIAENTLATDIFIWNSTFGFNSDASIGVNNWVEQQ
jgi:serine protease AprX